MDMHGLHSYLPVESCQTGLSDSLNVKERLHQLCNGCIFLVLQCALCQT